MNPTLGDFLKSINSEPNPEHIRKNDDGSLYIPISITQDLLDEIFLGMWSFEVTSVTFGRRWARGNGKMTCINPANGVPIVRNGDACIALTGNMRTDSPRLEAMILLSCAKKFGKVFGRDLNRAKDDAPLPAYKIEKTDYTKEEERLKALIEDCKDLEELMTYHLVVPKSLKKLFEKKVKELNNAPKE